MNWNLVLSVLVSVIGSVAGLAALSSVVAWIVRKTPPKVQAWIERYDGILLAAVKFAEKNTTDGTKIDTALDYFINFLEEFEKVDLTLAEKGELKSELSKAHAELEAAGTLEK